MRHSRLSVVKFQKRLRFPVKKGSRLITMGGATMLAGAPVMLINPAAGAIMVAGGNSVFWAEWLKSHVKAIDARRKS
jgi:hypothetical protein